MIKLSDHFTYKKLFKYSIPTILMMIFTSIYGVVDGFFVSNYAGKISFDALNFIYPFLFILGSIGFMFGSGGAALIGKTLGEGKKEKANQIFSQVLVVSVILALIFSILGFIFIKEIALLMKAKEYLLNDAIIYGRILLISLPFYVLQFEFQCLFATAEKPKLGLYVTLIAGIANMIFDALFVGIFKWGIAGAASATLISQMLGGVIPLIYFICPNNSLLRFSKFKFDFKSLSKVSINGLSELISNVSMSIVSVLYNAQLLNYDNGLTAYGVLMYLSMIFQAIFIGFTVGTAPIISYHFGANNKNELKNLLKKSLVVIFVSSLLMFLFGELFAKSIGYIFFSKEPDVVNLIEHAFRIFSVSFLLTGFTFLASSFFTALNNGLVSMLISFLRTIVFYVLSIIILPIFFKLDGIWWSIVVAEGLGAITSFMFIIGNKKKYEY